MSNHYKSLSIPRPLGRGLPAIGSSAAPGRDRLFGDAGRDELSGDNGRDALNGGTGRDRCDRGTGTDTARRCDVRARVP